MLSPDGQWLAFVSNESGDNEVYVRRFLGSRRKTRISSDGGQELAWAPERSRAVRIAAVIA